MSLLPFRQSNGLDQTLAQLSELQRGIVASSLLGLVLTRVLCGLWQPDDTLQFKEWAAGESASSSEESTGPGSGPVLSQVHLEQQLLPEASCFLLQLQPFA